MGMKDDGATVENNISMVSCTSTDGIVFDCNLKGKETGGWGDVPGREVHRVTDMNFSVGGTSVKNWSPPARGAEPTVHTGKKVNFLPLKQNARCFVKEGDYGEPSSIECIGGQGG